MTRTRQHLIASFASAIALLAMLFAPVQAHADDQLICVFDPSGKAGDYYRMMEEFALEASSWGASINLRAYTDEETAAKDYDAGQCQGVVATGVRLQRFNRFPSTIEAMGAIDSYDILQSMIDSLAKYESAAARLSKDGNVTVGFIPVGAVYLFVRDRSVNSVDALAGKRIATMDYDKAAPVMVDRIGAVMVPADLGSIGPKFNNGEVDAAYISAPAYAPFEMWRGLGKAGGIITLPLAQATLQLMVKESAFPEGFASKARTYFAGQFDHAVSLVNSAEMSIPEAYWINLPESDLLMFEEMFLSVRLKLRDDVGAYDAQMLSALRKIRCQKDPSRAECAEKRE